MIQPFQRPVRILLSSYQQEDIFDKTRAMFYRRKMPPGSVKSHHVSRLFTSSTDCTFNINSSSQCGADVNRPSNAEQLRAECLNILPVRICVSQFAETVLKYATVSNFAWLGLLPPTAIDKWQPSQKPRSVDGVNLESLLFATPPTQVAAFTFHQSVDRSYEAMNLQPRGLTCYTLR